nr:6372_t:CDS:2 [Entrophospora candida]
MAQSYVGRLEQQNKDLKQQLTSAKEEISSHLEALEVLKDWHSNQKKELLGKIQRLENNDIESAVKKLYGTSIAHLEPKRDIEKRVKILAGVSDLYFWQWPINGEYSGFICGHALPNVEDCVNFSPAQINGLEKKLKRNEKERSESENNINNDNLIMCSIIKNEFLLK